MKNSIQGKIAMITGAGRGIGRAIAERFAQDHCKLALVDLEPKGLEATTKKVQALGSQSISIEANISKANEVQAMVETVLKEWGQVDILVNNAGILRDASLAKMTEEEFDAVIAVNLKGVFLCGQACAKAMAEKEYGKIINISSVAARGNFGQTNYSAAKAGLIGMTKTWALELSRKKINVNAIAPGIINTEMTQTIPEDIRKKMLDMIPLKRAGEPEEVANLVHFLSTDASAYIQGEVISINGGFLM